MAPKACDGNGWREEDARVTGPGDKGDRHRDRRCWERSRRKPSKVKGGIRIPERRRGESLRTLNSLVVNALGLCSSPQVAPYSLLLFLLLTPVFCLPGSLLLFNTQGFLCDPDTSPVTFLDSAAPNASKCPKVFGFLCGF